MASERGGLSKAQSIRGAPIKLDDLGAALAGISEEQEIEMRGAPTVLDDVLNEI